MKKTNKGFSLVELIIVIAIMAILAGALAPALIKYINKSRLSSDIQNANTIATACQTALSGEKAYDACAAGSGSYTSSALSAGGDDFTNATKEIIGSTVLQTKAKKCMSSTCTKGYAKADYAITINLTANTVEVKGSGSNGHTYYPTADSCMTE